MQTPYCVVDAATLVEHIHEFKKWVYNGHIRLVVPSSTSERVEQLFQKSIEPKQKPQESTRPKSSGKTVRREHPSFDINARLTKAFLAWLERDKESWDPELPCAVEFQQSGEVYSPWKLAEERGDKREESPENGPATFAQAVAKSNLAKQMKENGEVVKGPVKPKLVARAPGSDKVPWNIGRKVPQIPLREVPSDVRPVFSYVLWRLHESSKRRADATSLIVLSDDLKAFTVGQKLDVVVQSMEEVRRTINAQIKQNDCDILGDLERTFGVIEPRRGVSQNGSVHVDEKDAVHHKDALQSPSVGDDNLNGSLLKDGVLSRTANSKEEEEEDPTEPVVRIEERIDNGLEGSIAVEKPIDTLIPSAAELEIVSPDIAVQTYPTIIDIAEETDAQQKAEILKSTDPGSNAFVAEKISNITAWIKNLAPKLSPNMEPNLKSRQHMETYTKSEGLSQPTSAQTTHPVVLQRTAEFSTPSPRQIPIASPAPASAKEDGDSDDEEIVFNPKAKRLSAQTKSPQPSPKQIAARNVDQTATQNVTQNVAPIVAHGAAQNIAQNVVQNLIRSPKPNASQSPKRHIQRGPKNAIPNRQPRNKTPPNAPAIIDPDAFGRSFATNPKANVHNNHPYSRYSPRGSPRRAIGTQEPELDYVLKSGNTRGSVRGKGKLWVP